MPQFNQNPSTLSGIYIHEKCKEHGWIDADNFSILDFKIRGNLIQHPVTSDYYLMLIAYTELNGQA